jgi:HB1, ASXL, restriction endonuclease HTH domain
MKDLQEVIAEKYRQIENLRSEINALEKAKQIIEGSSRETEKPRSQPEMAAAILEEVGKPMHVSQIVEQMKRKYGASPKPTTLGVTMYRYAQRGRRFYKVKGKPNTYGLIKWQSPEDHIENAKTLKVAS